MFVIYETRFLNRARKRPDDSINQHVKFHKAEDLRKGNKPCACFHFESCADASFDLYTVCSFYLQCGITVAKKMWSYLQNQYVSYYIVLNSCQYAICVSILIKTSKKLESNPDRSVKAEIQLLMLLLSTKLSDGQTGLLRKWCGHWVAPVNMQCHLIWTYLFIWIEYLLSTIIVDLFCKCHWCCEKLWWWCLCVQDVWNGKLWFLLLPFCQFTQCLPF